MTIEFEKLSAPFPRDKISWRAQTVTKAGDKALALAYIDARDVQDRLDAVCGPANWQNRFSHADKKTVCEIGIKIDAEWVWKADGAGDSDIEAEKGALSDAFKRCAVKWGIGRYLYDLDSPWVPCESREYNGKKQFVKFTADPWASVRSAPAAQKPAAEQKAPAPAPVETSSTADPHAKWRDLQMIANESIDHAKDVVEVNEWLRDNKAALAKMEAEARPVFEAVKARAMNRRAALSQKAA